MPLLLHSMDSNCDLAIEVLVSWKFWYHGLHMSLDLYMYLLQVRWRCGATSGRMDHSAQMQLYISNSLSLPSVTPDL